MVAAISCAIFAILVTIVPSNYTYTGTTSIFLCLNFVPACYLLYAKSAWDDIDLKLLYTELSKQLMEGKFNLGVLTDNEDHHQA
jgi:hypothetical protein